MMLLDIRTELITEGYEVLAVHKPYIKTPKRLDRQQASHQHGARKAVVDFLEHHTDFDQLIMETSNGRDFWIHVSCRKNKSKNRHQVLRLTKK